MVIYIYIYLFIYFHLALVLTTGNHPRGSLVPVESGDLEGLEVVLGRICAEHLLVLGEGLAHLGDGVEDLKAEHDVVLDSEHELDLELCALLDDEGGLLGVLDVLLAVELEDDGVVAVLEDDGELADNDSAGVVLGGDVVRVDAELLEVGDHSGVTLLLLELSGEVDFGGSGGSGRGNICHFRFGFLILIYIFIFIYVFY